MDRRLTNPTPPNAGRTWNDAERIAEHRALSPGERLRRTIEVSRVALRFANGQRR
jgi:hypothetical protein